MILFRSPLIVLDTETTGLLHHPWARVVDLAAVLLDTSGEIVSTFSTFVEPGPLDSRADEALAINHITRKMLLGAPSPEAACDAFYRWAEPHEFVTSFNVAFDRAMCGRMGLVDMRWANCIMVRAAHIMGPLGLLEAADPSHPRYRPDLPWLFPRLARAAEVFGVEVEGVPHRALTGATTAARIAVEIRRREVVEAIPVRGAA
jgi:DNA polymerase III epsilon subunit-like protein